MTKRVGDYELGAILGQGAFGIVRSAINVTSKQEFAIKIIDKEKIKREELIESLKKEIHILSSSNKFIYFSKYFISISIQKINLYQLMVLKFIQMH